MKKFLAFVMAASMALSLAACGGSSASTATSTTTEATSEAASAASTSGSKTDVAFVTDVGNIDDQSFNHLAGRAGFLLCKQPERQLLSSH